MTQTADLPQLSLKRYFDLVKRRRWQLVPVSLLGLIIGGVIAFFIPRFFVAETLLSHQQLPGGAENKEQPFRGIVESAKATIPLAVGDALDELNWPEVQTLDPFSREQFERDVESRVWVADSNAGNRKRDFALLRVQYRDRNGARSAEFLNTLVRVWVERRTQELRDPAQQQAQQAKEASTLAGTVYDKLIGEKQQIERTYGIRPDFSLDVQRQATQVEQAAKQARESELRKQRVKHRQMAKKLEVEQRVLEGIAPRVPPGAVKIEDQLKKDPQAKKLFLEALYYQQAAQSFSVGTKQRRRHLRTYEMKMQQIRQLVPQGEAEADGLIANPLHEEQRLAVKKISDEVDALAAEIAVKDEQLAADTKRLRDLVTGYGLYETKEAQIAEARKRREDALEDLRTADLVLSGLSRRLPVKQERIAQVPPAPTEPNILVVAVVGCVLGLFAAIGLILLLDMAQGSFKTVDDVERGLAVPVLGGVSHLETDEERESAVRSRRRVSLVAAALLVMVTVIVTLFYLVPTRLPPVVRDLLALLLGSGS